MGLQELAATVVIANLRSEVDALRAQRDALVEALGSLVSVQAQSLPDRENPLRQAHAVLFAAKDEATTTVPRSEEGA